MELIGPSQEVLTTVGAGLGLGSVLAIVCSWERNKSILWAIVHGWLSWLYVVYFAITRRPAEHRVR